MHRRKKVERKTYGRKGGGRLAMLCRRRQTTAAMTKTDVAEAERHAETHPSLSTHQTSSGQRKQRLFKAKRLPQKPPLSPPSVASSPNDTSSASTFLPKPRRFRCLTDRENGTFRPATERDLNAICLEAHRHGIDCWDRDVARMVHSTDVREYHPFRQYFQRLPAWDGRDRLHDLATRVSDSPCGYKLSTGGCSDWPRNGPDSPTGCTHTAPRPCSSATNKDSEKSTFCRALLPPQLQAYYDDSVDLARPDKVERQLTEMGLLNLDEFDRIPEKKHPLLKNLMQLSALNLRKAYQRHSQALPRIASFIGTSNSRELLSDPSGSRRFICVLVEHPIDSTGIDHAQIYAQLKAELERGERYWFNHGEENALRLHNAAFYRICPAEEVLRRYYRAAQPNEKVRPLSLPEIFARLRRLEPGAMAGVTLPKLAQALVAAGVQKIHTHYGNRYRVVEL